MNEQRLYRRVVRRSVFRSRSTILIVVLAIAALAVAYAAVECVLGALGMPALLVAPVDALAAVSKPGAIELGAAVVAAVVGLVLVFAAITPGRRSRHELRDGRMAVVVDDAVLAGALSRVTTRAAGVPASRLSTVVSRRRGSVRVTPTSGMPLDRAALSDAAESLIGSLAPKPGIRVGVTVATTGVVGS